MTQTTRRPSEAPAVGPSQEPVRRVPWSVRESGRPWPRATHLLLQGTGVLLAALTFFTVLGMPELPYHPARDLELRATYDTYRETGVPLVKVNGTGSWYGAVEGAGLTKAAGDDDPGSYLIASWMSHLTGSDSPYTGLGWVMALLCALPMLILPVTMARVFQRARAGLAMLALPAVTWLVNGGTVLVGTEYGLSDQVSPVRVYALYGLPAALLFASLVLLAYSLMRRPSLPYVVAAAPSCSSCSPRRATSCAPCRVSARRSPSVCSGGSRSGGGPVGSWLPRSPWSAPSPASGSPVW